MALSVELRKQGNLYRMMYGFVAMLVRLVCVYLRRHRRVEKVALDLPYHPVVEHPSVEPSDHHFRDSYHPVVAYREALVVHRLALDSSHDR